MKAEFLAWWYGENTELGYLHKFTAWNAWLAATTKEREACAKICDEACTNHGARNGGSDTADAARRNLAARIRMRSNAQREPLA